MFDEPALAVRIGPLFVEDAIRRHQWLQILEIVDHGA
jgi:hypothetical protein